MGKIAFVFAGQGAQYKGMGESLYSNSPAAKRIFDIADEIRPGTARQCFEGSDEELSLTANTQPCVFAVDLAVAMALSEAGFKPCMTAGFSLGEIAAISFAGILKPEEAFRLVCKRAEYMQSCAEEMPGVMFAVLKLEAGLVGEICKGLKDAYPVNFNCPGQTVVACSAETAGELEEKVKEARGKAVRLNVSGAFHSPFMASAAEKLGAYLENVEEGRSKLTVYSNVTGQPYTGDLKLLIKNQVKYPVLWQSIIEDMIKNGVNTFIETGPGKTLAGMIKKIDSSVAVYSVQTFDDVINIKNALL